MRRSLAAMTAALALGLMATPGAAAFDEIGNPCVGDDTEAGATMIGLSNQGSEPFMQSQVPPEHKFVITRWRAQVGPGIGPLAQQLVASHQVGEEDDVKVGESAIETLSPGTNEFTTRIPVSEYDHIGLRGPEQTLICHQALNTAGRVKGGWATGEQRHFEVRVAIGVPAIARVERDADNDGFGDESQDGCPASSAFQGPCPVVDLSARAELKRRAILVRVTASSEAPVQVFGYVNWQVRQKSGENRRLTVLLGSATARTLAAGATSTFRLPLSKPIKRRLERLGPKQSLRVHLTARATDLAGKTVQRRLTVRLPGRG